MPKVTFVKKARKDISGTDIKRGDSYYWWAFRFGGKHRSKTPPSARDLTQSDFRISIIDIEESISNLSNCDFDTIKDEIENITNEMDSLKDEQEEKLQNMPEQLQESSSAGELLQSRIDSLDEWSSEIQNVEVPDESEILEDFMEHDFCDEYFEHFDEDIAEIKDGEETLEKYVKAAMMNKRFSEVIPSDIEVKFDELFSINSEERKQQKNDMIDSILEEFDEFIQEKLSEIIDEIQGCTYNGE